MILKEEYKIALEAAIVAGEGIREIYKKQNYQIEYKCDESPVTIADKKSSEIIAGFLVKTNHPVIDEETGIPEYRERKAWEKFWLVDPLDGTREFISGNGEFTVNIALVNNGKPQFGVIYTPVSGDLYWGGPEDGLFVLKAVFEWNIISEMIKEIKPVIGNPKAGNVLNVAASRSHLDQETTAFISDLHQRFSDVNYINRGSSLKLCLIAEGLVDIYPRFSRTMEWDTAAGHAIVLATSGNVLCRETEEELKYNKENLANPPFIAYSANMQMK